MHDIGLLRRMHAGHFLDCESFTIQRDVREEQRLLLAGQPLGGLAD